MKVESPEQVKRRYSAGDDRPLAAYLGLMSAYGSLVGAGALGLRRRGVRLPERVDLRDLALLAVATHKVARLLSKDPVTSPLRAPFTRYVGQSNDAELDEEVRGTGLRKATGELVTCPFCLGQWVATGFLFGLVAAPRPTRWVASAFAVLAGSDMLQHVYAHLQPGD